MSLRLITGGANAGTSELVQATIRQRVSAGLTATLLVPSAPDAARALGESADEGLIGLTIRPFDEYLDEIWRQYGDGRVIAGRAERLAALEEVEDAWSPEELVAQQGSAGLIHLMSRLVQRHAETRAVSYASARNGVVRDLLRLAESYERTLTSAGLIERAAAHRLAVELLDLVSLPTAIGVDGFTGFTAPQEAFLRAAAERADVIVSLTYDPAIPATTAAQSVISRLSNHHEVLGSTVAPGLPAELVRLSESLGSAGTAAVAAAGHVALSEAWGGAAEAARVVAEVQSALAEGISPGSVAVVFRDVGPYLHDLRSALREAEISAECDATIPLSATPVGRILALLVRVESLSHEELMDVLRSPYSPAPNDLLDHFDASVRRRAERPVGVAGAASWFRERHSDTSAFLSRCKKACRSGTSDEAQREWYALVSGMLARAHRVDAAGLVVDAAAAREFMKVVAGTTHFRSRGSTRLATVLGACTVALSSTGSRRSVQVMSAERVRGRRWDCVILGGLNDGEFPRGSSEDALTDAEMVKDFAGAGVDVAPRSGVGEERLLFYQVVTRATKRLVLSRQTHDAEGRPLRPSIFWEELLDLYRDPVTREYYAGEPMTRTLGLDELAIAPHAPHTHRRALRACAMTSERGLSEQADEARLTEACHRSQRRRSPLSEAARQNASGRLAFSASEIETYLQCPYRWLIAHLVRPRELDRSFDAAAAGSLGHEIMRRFYEEYQECSDTGRVTPDTLEQAREIHARVARGCLAVAAPRSVAEELACRTIDLRTWGVIQQDAELLPGFVPLRHEWSFGISDDDEPEDMQGFALIGRVDRIDTDGQSLILTDYKSGAIGPEHGAAHFVPDGLVQLPLYARVAAQRLGSEVAAVLYRSFRGGKPRGLIKEDLKSSAFVSNDCLGSDEFRGVLEAGVMQAREAVEGMRAGRIDAEPLGGHCPDYCPARAFCSEWRPGRG